VLLLASTARAEPGIFESGMCEPPPPPEGCSVGGRCADDAGTCRALDGALRLCVPDDTLICCDRDSDCPYIVGGFGVCVGTFLGGSGLCTDPTAEYCASGSTRPTPAQVQRCHRSADGNLVVWAEGDCDLDGLSNGEERALGTDPCAGPPTRAIWVGDGCEELDRGCSPGDSCDEGVCARSADGHGTECQPIDSELYCGDGEWVCPDGTYEVVDMTRARTWCVPAGCEGAGIDRSFCVIDDEGEPVPYELGDCDRDGVTNEIDGDPCRPPTDAGTPPAPDAGMMSNTDAGAGDADAGSGDADAGPGEPFDGGSTTDGDAGEAPPPNVPVQFGGGGGCRCRASAGSTPAPWPLALLGLAWLSRSGARRARRRRRGARGRRSRRRTSP